MYIFIYLWKIALHCVSKSQENIFSSFPCVHACFVSGGCCLYVACGDTMLFVYVACMGGLVQFCYVFLVDILSSSHSLVLIHCAQMTENIFPYCRDSVSITLVSENKPMTQVSSK